MQLAIDDQAFGFLVVADRLLADTAHAGEIKPRGQRLQRDGERILPVHQSCESILDRLLTHAARLIDTGIMREEPVSPSVPLGRHVVVIEPLQIVRIAGHRTERVPHRTGRVLEIALGRPRRGRFESAQFPETLVHQVPTDRDAKQHEEDDSQQRDSSQITRHAKALQF